jgi:hypothetical protein
MMGDGKKREATWRLLEAFRLDQRVEQVDEQGGGQQARERDHDRAPGVEQPVSNAGNVRCANAAQARGRPARPETGSGGCISTDSVVEICRYSR